VGVRRKFPLDRGDFSLYYHSRIYTVQGWAGGEIPLLIEGTYKAKIRRKKFPSRKRGGREADGVCNSPFERGARLRRAGCVIHQTAEKFIPSAVIFSKVFLSERGEEKPVRDDCRVLKYLSEL